MRHFVALVCLFPYLALCFIHSFVKFRSLISYSDATPWRPMGQWMHHLGTSWKWVISFTPPTLYPRRKSPNTNWIGRWVGPRASLDGVEKRKFLTLLGLEHRPFCRPACSQSLQVYCEMILCNIDIVSWLCVSCVGNWSLPDLSITHLVFWPWQYCLLKSYHEF
jgi:hypothetical protein